MSQKKWVVNNEGLKLMNNPIFLMNWRKINE